MACVVTDMRHYRVDKDGYLLSIGTGNGGVEITEEEYNHILEVIRNKPEGDYILTSSLEWEAYTPEEPTEIGPTTEEILNILLGGAE